MLLPDDKFGPRHLKVNCQLEICVAKVRLNQQTDMAKGRLSEQLSSPRSQDTSSKFPIGHFVMVVVSCGEGCGDGGGGSDGGDSSGISTQTIKVVYNVP